MALRVLYIGLIAQHVTHTFPAFIDHIWSSTFPLKCPLSKHKTSVSRSILCGLVLLSYIAKNQTVVITV